MLNVKIRTTSHLNNLNNLQSSFSPTPSTKQLCSHLTTWTVSTCTPSWKWVSMNASTDSSSWISLAEASWPTFDGHDNGDKTKPKPTSIEESYTNQTSWPRRVLKGAKLEVVSLCPTPVLLKTNTCDWWAVTKVTWLVVTAAMVIYWEPWFRRWRSFPRDPADVRHVWGLAQKPQNKSPGRWK